jgi:hypothetical protein
MTPCQITRIAVAPAGEKRKPEAARSAGPDLPSSARQCDATSGASTDLYGTSAEDGTGEPKVLKFRRFVKKWVRALVVLAVITQLAACAAPAGLAIFSAGTGVAIGTSVDYTLNGIAYKTFVSPLPTVRQATLSGLNRMGMKVVQDKKSDGGWTIAATANDREIDINLESLTSRTTRMRVVASNSAIFKDRATEAAIIDQTADVLDRRASARS